MSSQRVALVTGAGKQRVGWHVADALARRGHDIAVHFNRSAAEAEQSAEAFRRHGVRAMALRADLSDEPAVTALAASVLKSFGRIDVLVNTAGLWQAKPLEEVTAEDVRRHFDANVLSAFLCCKHLGLAMTRQPEGGSIINFGDWACERPYLEYADYFASKGAIPTLTRTFAVELGRRNPNVRVNCILPGPVCFLPEVPEDERQRAIAGTLVQRAGRPDNVAQAVLHFIENDFVTGACLPVDGGRSVFAADSV